jgi:DNA-binding transcriptional ArsR family regulator
MTQATATVLALDEAEDPEAATLDRVFFALSDPVRRAILERLDTGALLVSELAAPFDISLQAVSRHIQVLVRAGLVQQERTGRISRCSLVIGPIFGAAVWLNRYTKYWQAQFDTLAAALRQIDQRSPGAPQPAPARRPSHRRPPRRS